MIFPRILRVHPSIIPNNVASLVKFEFNKTSLHDLEYLKLIIGTIEKNLTEGIHLLNQTFAQIMIKPDANMTLQKYPIRIVIDPSTDAEYYSG